MYKIYNRNQGVCVSWLKSYQWYCRFSYAGTGELANLFVGAKNFNYHICYGNIGREHSKILKRQTDRHRHNMESKEECIKWDE